MTDRLVPESLLLHAEDRLDTCRRYCGKLLALLVKHGIAVSNEDALEARRNRQRRYRARKKAGKVGT